MNPVKIVLLGEAPDPEHQLRWHYSSEALPDEGDIVELAAPVPGQTGVYDPKHVLSVRVAHRIWGIDGCVSLVCDRMHTVKRTS